MASLWCVLLHRFIDKACLSKGFTLLLTLVLTLVLSLVVLYSHYSGFSFALYFEIITCVCGVCVCVCVGGGVFLAVIFVNFVLMFGVTTTDAMTHTISDVAERCC